MTLERETQESWNKFLEKQEQIKKNLQDNSFRRMFEQKQVIDYPDKLPKDNWEFIQEFVNKFGRIPKDQDELNVLVEYVLKRQNPTEWSEEDEKKLDNVITQLKVASNIIVEDEINDSITFVKSLKVRVQPKQEWSEEDNRKIDELIALCEGRKKLCSSTVPAYKRMDELKEWLESFRPQNWTKEDKERYESCLQRLSTGNPEQPETINSKWFKEHVYPKPQFIWKPSDKQMEVLLSVIIKGSPKQMVLESLYQDLKKLKG